ncbi:MULTISPECIES: phosphate ABC transporter permease subunit PstC [unclassified Frankia]|uniref:phosphate ABC transporter permease subunit PstC n=1 Tax=unclassified Frankia TaxID=2632575 RepID=UPI002AD3CC54|nr:MULTISPECIES: phosphate ABC transporter permease subunit PstC [unclassified Frankia]
MTPGAYLATDLETGQVASGGDAGSPVEVRRDTRPRPGVADRVFRGVSRTAAITVMTTMGFIGVFLLYKALPALRKVGLSFFTETQWLPSSNTFGVGAVLLGTILIASVALVVAVPLSICTALFVSEYAPRRLRRPMVSLLDLMAAIPSIVYGLWGFFFLQPRAITVSRWLADHLGWFPFFHTHRGVTGLGQYASSTFIAGLVVALMVTPIITSIMREVFSQTPAGEREGALALGGTRWGMIRAVVLPFGRAGMVGAVMLGLGRALGETIAVYLIIAPLFASPGRMIHILEQGGMSISSLIALRYNESGSFGLAALFGAGLVLFALTLLVNALASTIISRSRSGEATEI